MIMTGLCSRFLRCASDSTRLNQLGRVKWGIGVSASLGMLLSAQAGLAQGSNTGETSPDTVPFATPDLILPGKPLSSPQPQFPASETSTPDLADPFSAYHLGPGDSLFVIVQRFPDLSFQATLDLQGNVIVPLAGAVNLNHLTLAQAQQKIFQIYNHYVVEPEVSLTLTAQRPVQVTVVGEVPRPGFYPLSAPQLSVALITAGGSTINADLRGVRIQRQDPSGKTMERIVDLFTPLKQGDSLPDIRLQDGDVVTIPRLDPSRLDNYDRNLVATSTLAQPEITVRILNYATGARGIEARFGSLRLRNGSRFLDALSQANVNPDLAAYNRIAVLRFNPEKGTADTIMVDASAAVHGDLAQNIPLQENDVIVVDRNLLANITYALNTFTQPFRDVLGFLLFFESLNNAANSLFGP